jgi:NAD(P)-dependent dehydrogenase (short-subunit alcohol dehydrogenase family)
MPLLVTRSLTDQRVTPLTVDVSDTKQVQEAAASVESLALLINNAGVQPLDDLSGPAALEQALAVNLFGPYRVSQAFLPALTRSRGTKGRAPRPPRVASE